MSAGLFRRRGVATIVVYIGGAASAQSHTHVRRLRMDRNRGHAALIAMQQHVPQDVWI